MFFANTGTEANEGAIKVARKVGKERWAGGREGRSWDDPACTKYRLVCFENGFHGRSMGSLSLTSNPKYQKPFAPMVPGVDVGKLNDYDSINLINEDTCGVFVEPIQGEGGINAATVEWLSALRKRCDEVGAVLVFDEIQVRALQSFRTRIVLTFALLARLSWLCGVIVLSRRWFTVWTV